MTNRPPTIDDRARDFAEEFAFLGEWDDRFQHLIDLGKSLPPLTDAEMSEVNRVRGCASQVWLVSEPSRLVEGGLAFRGASDAMIVSGLIGMLLRLYSDETPDRILAFDVEGFLADVGVADAITPQRSNGLRSMIARIRAAAEAAA
ncbi:cysteine desulfuration protein SufE [bacterium]|nr:cysteine desulfuration protein SufE [bacterium]